MATMDPVEIFVHLDDGLKDKNIRELLERRRYRHDAKMTLSEHLRMDVRDLAYSPQWHHVRQHCEDGPVLVGLDLSGYRVDAFRLHREAFAALAEIPFAAQLGLADLAVAAPDMDGHAVVVAHRVGA